MSHIQGNDEIKQLLEDLNYWEKNYGTTYSQEKRLKSTGEANARIADLKEKLKSKGMLYHWDGSEYVLDTVVEPKPGE